MWHLWVWCPLEGLEWEILACSAQWLHMFCFQAHKMTKNCSVTPPPHPFVFLYSHSGVALSPVTEVNVIITQISMLCSSLAPSNPRAQRVKRMRCSPRPSDCRQTRLSSRMQRKIPPHSADICNSYCCEKVNLSPAIVRYSLSEYVHSWPSCILNRGQRASVQFSKHNWANTDLLLQFI